MSSIETDGIHGAGADAVATVGYYDATPAPSTTLQVLLPSQDLLGRSSSGIVLRTEQYGKVTLQVADRISVDDVFIHLVQRELYRLAGGLAPGDDVNTKFIDFLVRERFVAR